MFDVGQKIVCVDDRFPKTVSDLYDALPKEGTVYVVRDVVQGQTLKLSRTVTILLVGLVGNINGHGIENGFNAKRFVPLEEYRQKQQARKFKKKPLTVEVN